MRIAFLLFLVLPAALGCVQQIPPAAESAAPETQKKEKLCRITGRTVHALTGEPVPRVRLILRRVVMDSRNLGAVSDAEGRFVIEKVEPGMYYLLADRSGFLRRAYSSRGSGYSPTPLNLTANQEVEDLRFQLMPQGVITGKVLDEEGEPVQEASINVFRQVYAGGRGRTPGASGESTNDVGEYRAANLAPGRYIVQAAAEYDFRSEETTKPKKDEVRESYVPTFYPGVTDPASAATVEVGPGQEVSGINITLRKSRVYIISGKVIGATASELKMMNVSVRSREHRMRPMVSSYVSPRVNPDSSFTLANVQPGSYNIVLMLGEGGRPQVVGRTTVDVAEADVEGVILQVGQGVVLSGLVRLEGKEKAEVHGLRLTLRPVEDGEPFPYTAIVKEDGTFRIEGVMPDRYSVAVYDLPEGAYLKSVRFGNHEAPDKSVDLSQTQGSGSIELILSPYAGTVEGLVSDDGKPAPGSSVLLVPDPPKPEEPYKWKWVNCDQNGWFEIKGVVPGEYKLYASKESLSGADEDPEALKPFEEKAVKVTVAERGRERVEIELAKSGDAQTP